MLGRVLQPWEVEANWWRLSALLGPAVAEGEGEIELDDIPRLVQEHHAFIGAIFSNHQTIEVALVCETRHYPRANVLNVMYVGGSPLALTKSKHLYPALEAVAIALKCSIIQGLCRPAAARLFSRMFGLKPVYTVLRKEVGL